MGIRFKTYFVGCKEVAILTYGRESLESLFYGGCLIFLQGGDTIFFGYEATKIYQDINLYHLASSLTSKVGMDKKIVEFYNCLDVFCLCEALL